MGTERKDGASDDPRAEQPDERPTVIPKFDPAELAKRTADSATFDAADADAARAAHPTLASTTTTQLPESTRQRSDSTRRSSLLSLADARPPSLRPAQSGSNAGLAAVDRWTHLQLDESDEEETRPGGKKLESLRAWSAEESGTPSDEVPTREHPVVPEQRGAEPPAHSLDATTKSPPPPRVRASSGSTEDTIREMRDRFSLGDYTGALALAERLAFEVPQNAEVRDCAEKSRHVLRQMYTARIGPLDRVPVVMVAREQLRWLSIDHRAGFVLSHVDGVSSLETILDVSGMPSLDALRILCDLAQQRIISFR